MEKASKVILTFSVIIFVISSLIFIAALIGEYRERNSSGGGCQLDTLAVPAHNRMFDAYIDKVVKGKVVKNLCAKIGSYNKTADEDYLVTISMEDGTVLVNHEGMVEVLNEKTNESEVIVRRSVISNRNYFVTGEMDDITGIITNIIITPK